MKNSIFKVEDLVLVQQDIAVINHVSFELYSGEVLGILGLRDSGILALMDVLTGNQRVRGGTVYYGGQKMEYRSVREARSCGIYGITQQTSLIPRLSILDNLTVIGSDAWKNFLIRRKKLSEHIKQIIEQYGGNVDLQKKVYELTGFERQIIEIYKAIENNVKILCVYGLGENCTAEELGILRDILGKMKENGIGIIFIHYNSEKIQKFCDRILIMRHGFLADEVETAETSEQDLFRRLSAERGRKSAERKSPGKDGYICGYYDKKELKLRRGEVTALIVTDFSPEKFCVPEGGLQIASYEREFWEKAIFDNFTLEENILLKSYRYHQKFGVLIDRRMLHFLLRETCERYGFDYGELKKYPRDASPKKLKEIVMFGWLIDTPDILVLEEPFYAADEEIIACLYKYVDILREKGTSIVCGGDNWQELRKIADRVINL